MRFLFILFIVAFLSQVQAQTDTKHNYVVIGAFEKLSNAVRYTSRANNLNFNAHYALNPDRKLYYVYILDTEDKRKAFAFLMKTRVETEFKEAWVFDGALGVSTTEAENAVAENKKPVKEEIPIASESAVSEPVTEELKTEVSSEKVEDKTDSVASVEEKKPEGKPFYFKLTNGVDGNQINGEVHVISSKSSEYQAFPVNQIVYITAPPKGVFQIITSAPGYKEIKRAINYNDPGNSASGIGPQQEAIIALPLTRVRQGDYIEFNDVQFFPDAVLLKPDSRHELDGLVDLLKENTKYKVQIHSHCNGNNSREITTKGTSSDFFALNESNGHEEASAKKLTQLRADLVKEYLVTQGIDEKRITTKGEGGKQYIYSPKSPSAAKNDRIEVEVKKGK